MTSQVGFLSKFLENQRNARAIRFLKGPRVLDAGCNTGELRHHLPSTMEYVGVDRDPSRPHPFTFYARDLSQPLNDLGVFDSIAFLATIEHIPGDIQPKILSNLVQVLRPGGMLVVTTPSQFGDKVHDFTSNFKLVSKEAAEDHEKILSLDELATLLKNAGLEIETKSTFLFGMNQLVVGKKPQ